MKTVGVMMASKDWNVEFVNVELKFKPALYLKEGENFPSEAEMLSWCETMALDWWRVGFGYNDRSSSLTVSFTFKGGKTTDKALCVTQHGRTVYAALCKLYVIFELCGGKNEGFKFAESLISAIEDQIENALDKLK